MIMGAMGLSIKQYSFVQLVFDEEESEAVQRAISSLKRDLRRVLDVRINETAKEPYTTIMVGTIGTNAEAVKKADTKLLQDEKGNYRKEAFLIQEKEGELLIVGTDRRGTIFGIYDLCEEWLGVSPWYFWADVPVRKKTEVFMKGGYCKVDYPSVEYRGIFINDEEELEHWVQRYMGEETIGVKTYELVFELLLRLKMNYIWPAMHVNSFNAKQENGALANRMGIVVGTSHCDMLMRSNNREWKPWLKKKGYAEKEVEYDYSIPGRNREILEEYWRESIEQNKDYEVSYTLGMRGIHDSGFETKSLAGKTGEELLQAKVALLDSVIKAQERMIGEVLGKEKDTLKTFVPYKEVLELYDHGLEVPEDLTLIWVNDNYGYVRRYPGEKEKQRTSGNGIYYHNSYWAPPGGSYLFLCSIPLAHTRNELKKAYQEGIQKLWVTNFGAMKPLEQQMTYYARLAWEVGKENAITEKEQDFLRDWIDKTFSGNLGKELAPILTDFDQLTNTRKLEQMDIDAFSQTAYGDEAVERIHRYEDMFLRVNTMYETLPAEEKDAFFQLVLMKIHAAYYTNSMYYYADRSNLCMKQGKAKAAEKYTKLSKQYDNARRQMLYYYNHVMANGKWNGIMTPEDFPPPRTAMYPACMPPLLIPDKRELVVTTWNDKDEITFIGDVEPYCYQKKWIELASAGTEEISYEIQGPDWLTIGDGKQDIKGSVGEEKRILLCLDKNKIKEGINKDAFLTGTLVVRPVDTSVSINGGREKQIPIQVKFLTQMSEMMENTGMKKLHVEEDGHICVEADTAEELLEESGETAVQQDFWEVIPNLGRNSGSLIQAKKGAGGTLTYEILLSTQGCHTLELHRYPSLNAVGQIRIGVSVDHGEIYTLESNSRDEHCGKWKENVRNNVDKLCLKLPELCAGKHQITLHSVDDYFAFSRFVIYTDEEDDSRKRRKNSLGMLQGENQALPLEWNIQGFTEQFYGKNLLPPRPEIYLVRRPVGDTVTMEDTVIAQEKLGIPVKPADIWKAAEHTFSHKGDDTNDNIRIDAATALAQSPYAYTRPAKGMWQYCNSPSHGGTGLAMYIREEREPLDEHAEQIPTLNYQMQVQGGTYQIWLHMHMWGTDTCCFTIGIDGNKVPIQELYHGHAIWRYSLEQVWVWIPVHVLTLTPGEHELTIYDMSSRTRFDRIYLTTGEELPPLDEVW